MGEIKLEDIRIRDDLQMGDISYIMYLQSMYYSIERNWKQGFEEYVLASAVEFLQGFNPARDHVWIAEYDGRIVGSMALKDRGEAAQLRYLIVLPECRGCRLGKKLFTMSIDFAREVGYKKVWLATEAGCSTAVPMYERLGFVRTGEHVNDLWADEPVLELEYELEL
ncbi:MAG: GNAT family N-acetyltransferase [Mogibacterium sp.]|nr:GNAT family N-acetyltransferase [Mogibacterium sp.]